nr:hypothetical protein [Candidatus Neomarinimicrobiota bacterium]
LTILTVLIFLFTACNKIIDDALDDGLYEYTAFDSEGVHIVEGTFSIVFSDSISITGEWDFVAIGDPENIGPQIGEGQLIGTMEGNDFYAGLNPDMDDNNVNFVGVVDGDKISGVWIYSGYAGVLNSGPFTAEK